MRKLQWPGLYLATERSARVLLGWNLECSTGYRLRDVRCRDEAGGRARRSAH